MKFFDVLFDAGELTCFSDTLWDVELREAVSLPDSAEPQFFSINPMHTSRADSNVTSYRNILLEFDDRPVSEQLSLIKESGVPYSTLVYSGGKSIHAIISLKNPLSTVDEYRRVVAAIYKKFAGIDRANSNPSRFSRVADSTRSNGERQELLDLKERASLEAVLAWTGPLETVKPTMNIVRSDRMMPLRVQHFLKFGAKAGERNGRLFQNSCEMFRAGFSEDEIYDMVAASPLDLPDREVRACIRSARKASNI